MFLSGGGGRKTTFYGFITITSDNGTEFSGSDKIAKVSWANFYLLITYKSCDRPLNENIHGLIRWFLPKRINFNLVSDREIPKIEHMKLESLTT